MSPAVMTAPGPRDYWAPLGPCVEACSHKDCAASRRMADTACGACGQPIGYERLFHVDADQLVHDDCEDR